MTAYPADMPPDPCPDAHPQHGVKAFAWHQHVRECAVCGTGMRLLWWIDGQHVCSRCQRIRSDRAEGWTT